MKPKRNPLTRTENRPDQTSRRLLLASIDVFGRLGFEGTSTRALAQAAGVNLQAIPYYFGSKEGLYLAVAEHIASEVGSRVGAVRDQARSMISQADEQQRPLSEQEARRLLSMLLQAMAEIFLSKESEAWALFMMREQMHPTDAFALIYGRVIKPMLELIQKLLACLLRENPESQSVKLRSHAVVGNVMIFRFAHATVLAQMSWDKMGPEHIRIIQTTVHEIVSSIRATNELP
jgi:TetR/AcrR family transcriptional regulator, regulator of cefoperazone and chloramphenicol sensitivity